MQHPVKSSRDHLLLVDVIATHSRLVLLVCVDESIVSDEALY